MRLILLKYCADTFAQNEDPFIKYATIDTL